MDVLKYKITEKKLLNLGFVEGVEECVGYETYTRDGIEVWDFNGKYWLVDMLDQVGINVEFKTMGQLADFFKGCQLDLFKKV